MTWSCIDLTTLCKNKLSSVMTEEEKNPVLGIFVNFFFFKTNLHIKETTERWLEESEKNTEFKD